MELRQYEPFLALLLLIVISGRIYTDMKPWSCDVMGANKKPDWLIVDDGRPVTVGRLLFDDIDELKGAADGRVWVRPFGTLKVTNL